MKKLQIKKTATLEYIKQIGKVKDNFLVILNDN